jgi:Sigma-70, region 4
MYSAEKFQEIVRLLHEERLSHRQIATRLGISRGTVNSIARGQSSRRRKAALDGDGCLPTPMSLPHRCPRCGYRVYLPCQICLHRAADPVRKERRMAAIARQKTEGE